MGLVTKCAMMFADRSPALAFPVNAVLVPQVQGERGHSFLMRPMGLPLAICSVAFSRLGSVDATRIGRHRFARDRLRMLLGANADKGYRRGAATDWGSSPHTLGATRRQSRRDGGTRQTRHADRRAGVLGRRGARRRALPIRRRRL